MTVVKIIANYYQQYDADHDLEVPAEGFNGWQKGEIPLDLDHTALVVMHSWDFGRMEDFPGWYNHVEYIPRAKSIQRDIFPPLLGAVRDSGMALFHVVGGGNYYKQYPGYKKAKHLAGRLKSRLKPLSIKKYAVRSRLDEFRRMHCISGVHNQEDINRAFSRIDFGVASRPLGDEGIAEDEYQLFALCKEFKIDHLIYVGFAINWCLLLSPGGMAEMSKFGLLCSTIRQATTAVENKETARGELCKEIALWRVAISFGFVFDLDDFINALLSR
ncbi:MAG: hypothetical protein ACTSWN_01290 [Promethearchaeota archaeon]